MKNVDLSTFSNSELLRFAKESMDEIRMPKELYMGAFTLESKLPWKATQFRELLLHRFCDLFETAVNLYETDRTIPTFILTRAVVENTAMMYSLSIKTTEFFETKNEDVFDEFLMNGMFGGREAESPRRSYNILTAIDHLDKIVNGMRKLYDILSEFTHPNYAGVMGSYSKTDIKKYITYLGKEHSKALIEFGLLPMLVGCLEVFIDYYDLMGKTLKTINDFYERNAKPNPQ